MAGREHLVKRQCCNCMGSCGEEDPVLLLPFPYHTDKGNRAKHWQPAEQEPPPTPHSLKLIPPLCVTSVWPL